MLSLVSRSLTYVCIDGMPSSISSIMDQSGETGQTDAQDGNVEKVAISQSGSQMRNPRLPQELLDMIVDNLCYERNTLHSLALVCHAFAPKAQRHLHRRVHLVRDISKLQRAADVYTSPTLLAYVQELVVDLPPYSGDEHAALAAVTPIFASVNRLVLRGCLGVKGSREFKKGYDFLANFRAIQSLSLIDFTPPYPSGFYDMLCNFPCISSLQISGLSLNPPGEAQIPGQTFTALPQTRDILPCLQNLSLTRISLNIERELVTWLSTVIRPGGCTTLQLDLANFTPANALIRHCGANLVHLGVHSWPLVGGESTTSVFTVPRYTDYLHPAKHRESHHNSLLGRQYVAAHVTRNK